MNHLVENKIDFYSKNEVAIREIIDGQKEAELLQEVAFYCGYLFKHMSNLKGTKLDELVAKGLLKVKDKTIESFNLLRYLENSGLVFEDLSIVNFKGKGEKRFYSTMDFIDVKPIPSVSVITNLGGFGLFGKDINYYGVQSINAIFMYYAAKYKGDEPSLFAFADASNACAEIHLLGNSGFGIRQGQVVCQILMELFPKR